jgi:hypothetical protein
MQTSPGVNLTLRAREHAEKQEEDAGSQMLAPDNLGLQVTGILGNYPLDTHQEA